MSTSDTVNQLLTVNKRLASYFATGIAATAEGALKQGARASDYAEQYVQNVHGTRVPALGAEGSYFVGVNVPGTPIIDTAALTAFAATTPTMIIFNGNATGGKSIFPTRFRTTVVAPGASGTEWSWQWLIDTGNRYSSGGTALTLNNTNIATNTASQATIRFGALTATAANASRIVASGKGRTVIKVAGDEYTFEFGNSAPVAGAGMPTEGTLQLTKTWQLPPIEIPPQMSLLWYEYGASQATAASFDFIGFEYVER